MSHINLMLFHGEHNFSHNELDKEDFFSSNFYENALSFIIEGEVK